MLLYKTVYITNCKNKVKKLLVVNFLSSNGPLSVHLSV